MNLKLLDWAGIGLQMTGTAMTCHMNKYIAFRNADEEKYLTGLDLENFGPMPGRY